jgi:tripartite-type tricarboxylate transporter receptor subunit TctC
MRGRRHGLAALCICALAATAISACASSPGNSISTAGDNASSSATSAAKPDFAFYKGKTITNIVEQAPGGSYYTTSAILDPLIAKYLHASVALVTNASGDTLVGQDQIAASSKDGLTFGTMALPTDVYNNLANLPSVNFPIQSQGVLGGITRGVFVYVACTAGKPAFSSWDQILAGKGSFSYLTTSGGGNEEYGQLLFGSYNLPAKMLTGYSSTPLAITGCQRGDGSVASSPVASFTPKQFASGQVKPVLVSGPGPTSSAYYPYLKNIPTLDQLTAKQPPTTAAGKAAFNYLQSVVGETAPNQTFFAPAGTPPARVAALAAAVKWAMAQPAAQKALISNGLSTQWLTAAQIQQDIKVQVQTADTAKKYFTYGT